MRQPLHKAADSLAHRHIAQAALGRELLLRDASFAPELRRDFGVDQVRAGVLYANGVSVDLLEVPAWWTEKAYAALLALAR